MQGAEKPWKLWEPPCSNSFSTFGHTGGAKAVVGQECVFIVQRISTSTQLQDMLVLLKTCPQAANSQCL